MKHSGLTWDQAQTALVDGYFVGHSIWHHTTEQFDKVRICLDSQGNLVTRPPEAETIIDITNRRVVGRWQPSPAELESNEWIAFAWEVAKGG